MRLFKHQKKKKPKCPFCGNELTKDDFFCSAFIDLFIYTNTKRGGLKSKSVCRKCKNRAQEYNLKRFPLLCSYIPIGELKKRLQEKEEK